MVSLLFQKYGTVAYDDNQRRCRGSTTWYWTYRTEPQKHVMVSRKNLDDIGYRYTVLMRINLK